MGQGVVRLGCVLKLDPERDPLQQFDVGVLGPSNILPRLMMSDDVVKRLTEVRFDRIPGPHLLHACARASRLLDIRATAVAERI